MFLLLRKFLVTFLLVLQFFAPLVHAHVGESVPAFSHHTTVTLHVPGLEIYGTAQQHAFHAIAHPSSSDGIIVGVDAGIKDAASDNNIDPDNNYFLPEPAIIFNAALSPFDSNFSPQAGQFVCQLLFDTISPRAPPAL